MASVISVLAKIQADSTGFVKGMKQAETATQNLTKQVQVDSKKIEASMKEAGKKSGSGFASGLKGFIGPALFAGGIAGLTSFTKELIVSAQAEKASNALIENIATSMGLFGNQTAEVTNRLTKYAETQSLATGIDEDSIKAGQAKLLTFSAVGKEAGKMGGQFDRAMQAAMDLQSAGFGKVESNAVSLGKALQNPVKGMGALSRAGVTFSESEKAAIKAMVESGNQMKAQDVLLKAIEMQVGGSSDAIVNQTDRMKAGFANLKETIGLSVLPAFDKFGKFMSDNVLPALTTGAEKLPAIFESVGANLSPIFQTIGDVMSRIWVGIQPAIDKLLPVFMQLSSVVSPFGIILNNLGTFVDPLILMINTLANTLSGVLGAAIPVVSSLMESLITAFMILVNAILPPMSTLMESVGTMIVELFTNIGPQLATVGELFTLVAEAIAQVIPPIFEIVNTLLPPLFNLFNALIPPIVMIAKIIITYLVMAFKVLMAIALPIIKIIADVIAGVVNAIAGFVNWLMGFMQPIFNAIIDGINKVLEFLGQKPIPKMDTPKNLKDAEKQGERLGEARANGEDKGYLKNRKAEDIGGGAGAGGAGGGGKATDPMEAIRKDAKNLLDALKPMKIASRELGVQEKAVADNVTKLNEKILEAFKVKGISQKTKDGLIAMLKKRGKELQGIARQRDKIANKIQKRDSLAKQITEDLLGQVKVTELGGGTQSIIDNLKNRIQSFKDYSEKLKKLKALGVSDAVYKQILEAGTEAGGFTATALIEGGADAIAQINALTAEANTVATSVGKAGADSLYNAGVDMATGLIKGLESKDAELKKAATKIANTLTAEVKKQLGIKSPSKVFMALGGFVGAGMEEGVLGSLPSVGKAFDSLIPDANFNGNLGVDAIGAGGKTQNNIFEITVNAGAGADGNSIGKTLVTAIKNYERQNGQVWVRA